MVAVGYHKRATIDQQKGRRRNAETPMRLSDAPLMHTPFAGRRDGLEASRMHRELIRVARLCGNIGDDWSAVRLR